MCANLLVESGHVNPRSTFRALTHVEMSNDAMTAKRAFFDAAIEKSWGPALKPSDFADDPDLGSDEFDLYEDDEEDGAPQQMPEADDYDTEAMDTYIHDEVVFPKGDSMKSGKVTSRKSDQQGKPIGRAHQNPFMDSRVYNVEFPDGHMEEYAANVIAEHMYSQVDEEGVQYLLLDEITDHKSDATAVAVTDTHVVYKGHKSMRKTTKGWKLLVQWKNGSSSWTPLKDLKESNPVEVAEYAVANTIVLEPAFLWWVPFTLKKRDQIIAAVNSRIAKKTHTFGIRVPKDIAEANAIDKDNGNALWYDAVQKEMKNVMIVFDVMKPDRHLLVGYKHLPCHMIWDVKMDFTRKCRLVAGGHLCAPPKISTYASVIGRMFELLSWLLY
jgi:hypothetical protein